MRVIEITFENVVHAEREERGLLFHLKVITLVNVLIPVDITSMITIHETGLHSATE